MRRGVAAVVVLLVTATLLPVVGAQSAATPSASDWTPPGPFERSDLTTGGVHDAEAPPSVRGVGEPISGSVGVEVTPPSPLKTSSGWAEPGSTIENDRIDLFGTAYADAVGEYELVVVYWSDKTRTTNGTTVEYAGDQSVQRVSFNMTRGYNRVPIKLRSNYDAKTQMTMWLERDGERVDGARWRYQKRSNPLTAAPGFDVDSKGDLWRWGAVNILLPAIPGIFIGRRAATHFLKRTITSPRKGAAWWLFIVGAVSLVALIGATWQTAAVLSQAPFVAGLLIAVLSFVAILGIRDQDVERAEFNKKDLETVTNVSGDETVDARSEQIELRDIVRRDGQIFMPAEGLRPFLARYWADAASVDESDLETVNNTEGDVSKKYEIEPTADETLHHKPARLAFSPTVINKRDGQPEEDQSTADRLLSPLGRVNWSFVGPAIIGGAAVYFGIDAWLGVPSLSMLAAILPGLIAGYHAEDGELSFEPAPYHFTEARAILAHERKEHSAADTFDKLHERMAEVDMDSKEQALDFAQAYMKRAKTEMDGMLGTDGESVDTDTQLPEEVNYGDD